MSTILQPLVAIAAVQPPAISMGSADGLRCELVQWEHRNTWSMVCSTCVIVCQWERRAERGPLWFVDDDFFLGGTAAMVGQLVSMDGRRWFEGVWWFLDVADRDA